MPPPDLTRRLLIDGRVQGVGFRWALSAEATALARAQREHWPPVTLGQAHQFAREEVERLLDGDNA